MIKPQINLTHGQKEFNIIIIIYLKAANALSHLLFIEFIIELLRK